MGSAKRLFWILSVNFSSLLLGTAGQLSQPIPARVQVPVADLLYESAQQLCPTMAVTDFYRHLGLGDQYCQRAYQLLLQEPVLIVAEQGSEVQVAVPQVTYLVDTRLPGVYTNLFWMQRADLI
ncbi:MAG TPA: hypothetical protein VJJ83_02365, partial [Candidatus Babeliales bacterium]|nr:hypothetical protein [Candidatus Babeliales bacterium]